MVRDGKFRADLLYRLNVLTGALCRPLRERPGDVMILAEHLMNRGSTANRKRLQKSLHPESAAMLISHLWPGNVRELENLMLRQYLLESGRVIRIECVDEEIHRKNPRLSSSSTDAAFKTAKAEAVAAFEQSYVTALLSRSGGNLSLASRLSGKDRSDLSKLLRKHGIQRQQFQQH
jgi:DNA-binding NtrC family response regulator